MRELGHALSTFSVAMPVIMPNSSDTSTASSGSVSAMRVRQASLATRSGIWVTPLSSSVRCRPSLALCTRE